MKLRSPLLLLSVCLLLPILITGCGSVSSIAPPPTVSKAPPKPAAKPVRADRVLLEKSKRTLTLYAKGKRVGSYHVALGRNPVGAKVCQGDYRTPEGQYRITGRNPASHYYRSLRLSYPNEVDIERARKQGCDPGGNIVIHGLENGYGWVGRVHTDADWTSGCIAVTNEEMDRLWQAVAINTPVEIRP